jgi:hypothetical protein
MTLLQLAADKDRGVGYSGIGDWFFRQCALM